MARKAKDNPTNMADADIADTLASASRRIPDAKDAVEAARGPLREIKALVKATGIDWDIFALVSGIANLEEDDQRNKRWRKLQIAINAILKGKITGDLFGLEVSISPARERDLRDASAKLQDVQPPAPPPEPGDDDDEMDEAEGDAPTVVEPEEPEAEDPPPLVAADMPAGAGFAYNNGMLAGRQGHGLEANPHESGTVEHRLWESGRVAGENWAVRFFAGESLETGEHALMCRDDGGIEVFRHHHAQLVERCVAALNAAQAETDELLGPAQVRDLVRPLLADPEGDFSVVFAGKFDPAPDQPQVAAEPAASKVEFIGTPKQKREQAYFFGYDAAAAGQQIADIAKGRRGEIKAQIEAGFADRKAGKDPKHQRPAPKAPAHSDGEGGVAEASPDLEGQGGETVAVQGESAPAGEDLPEQAPLETEPAVEPVTLWVAEMGRVGVRQDDIGQWVLFDLLDEQPLIDAPGEATGTVWAGKINHHFADRLETVTRTELINASKTLAMGRLLSPQTSDSTSIFAAV